MLTLSKKIRLIRRDTLRVTQSEFAKKLGFSRIATISDYEKGKRAPDITTLRKIAALGNVTIDYLISEQDTSKNRPYTDNYINIDVYNTDINRVTINSTKNVPVQEFMIPKKYYQKDALTIKFDGDSMSPTMINGAIVGIDRTDKNLISGKLFALWIKHEGLTVRRVFVYPDRIELKPDNTTFPTTTIETIDVTDDLIIGSIGWIFQGL